MEKTKKTHRWWKWLLGLVALYVILNLAAGAYFFNVAMVPSHKSFVSDPNQALKKSDPLYHQKRWFKIAKKLTWHITSASGNYRLVADYIPAAQPSKKSVLIAHGFMQNKESMGAYAYLFHQLGYNVLMPDARAHGQSQGKYIGYGWPERFDERKWINRLIQKNGQKSQIVMFGVSMGGATTMMTSGIKLPSQVKAFIEDCGYTSLQAELDYEAGNLYHIPNGVRQPIEWALSGINRMKNGFFTQSASSVASLQHNHRPMLFIHGAEDTFVPTKMVYQNYAATKGPKQLWVVPKAKHASSYDTAQKAYQSHIAKFLNQYVK